MNIVFSQRYFFKVKENEKHISITTYISDFTINKIDIKYEFTLLESESKRANSIVFLFLSLIHKKDMVVFLKSMHNSIHNSRNENINLIKLT